MDLHRTQSESAGLTPAREAANAGKLRRRRARSLWSVRILPFLLILGPGFITANVDNDPGGILTYSQAGASFGYLLLWTLIPTTIALIVIQEMAARMGAITGKGLSDLIREEFGFRATFFAMLVLSVADFGNILSEFSGLALGMSLFDVSKFLAVPVGALLIWLLVVRGRYRKVELILIALSLIYFSYAFSAVLAHPDWSLALRQMIVPHGVTFNHEYLVMVIGLIGTTITPWMQFYLQASIVEKGIGRKEYALSRWDVIVGCIITDVVAFFIVVACAATLYVHGHRDVNTVADVAQALGPLAGRYASLLFAVGLINAALLSAAILPLATAYNVCEGLGLESGVDKRFSEAPAFYALYTLLIGAGASLVLIPKLPLLKVIIYSQVANGILLPFVLVFMLLLVNREDVMGDYRNSWLGNLIAWSTSVILVILTVVWIFTL
ncbi:MAG TPA: Nramp family divalent metal transporter [Terriglobales bacterium]|nr:Nramp family divalent metal transporter [Terriglobales bacterium]